METAQRFAAIDIGTVTCRMLVADVLAGKLTELHREYRITNLGIGVDATGRLAEDAMDRVVDAVRDFCAIRDTFRDKEHPEIKTVCLATSASRDAKNGDIFAKRLAELGVQLTIIPGEREAELTFLGAGCLAGRASDSDGRNVAVVDIGGGSTELIVGDPARGLRLFSRSFNIGCRRMTEKFLTMDPPTTEALEALSACVRQEMGPYFSRILALNPRDVIAVAGTATSAVAVHLALDVYDPERVHGYYLRTEELEAIIVELSAMDLATRKTVVGLDPKRADVIIAGLIILREILVGLSSAGYIASESDILQGIILDFAQDLVR